MKNRALVKIEEKLYQGQIKFGLTRQAAQIFQAGLPAWPP